MTLAQMKTFTMVAYRVVTGAEEGSRRCSTLGENLTCDACGKSYDRFREDRFWHGTWRRTVDGESRVLRDLCDDCHRDLVREYGR